ncbi:transcription-repair coupling factor [Pseudovibrio sp. Tun.PSC04-5.I4]|uniref:transcription-repair coupling factor n=1 Tax=Pseudovibrio sp. Tun.PSC04-5.I4 TaxID=1798213 RepID=UPI0008903FB6|nr:transcription-repair coupling factor [Pseudovibrio sp. Tun.PSC04-5.I4]SDR05849.1 transcription-repair coupling factor [Pseudovibrio sp. Tun.PSC04-5.I4]
MFESLLKNSENITLASVPDGAEAYVLSKALSEIEGGGLALTYVARDATRMAALTEALGFFAPDVEVLQLPAWDCLPYDRVSPHGAIVARRLLTLLRLAKGLPQKKKYVLITTVNAALQRLPIREWASTQILSFLPGNRINPDRIIKWLEVNGFARTPTVRETGEYAVRGGIIDLFSPATKEPVRLDFFGDTLESIRSFDTDSQRTLAQKKGLTLVPMSEIILEPETISRFRRNYVTSFGAAGPEDILYQSISEGRRYAGMEHWLPLFHEKLETLFDYIGDVPVILDANTDEMVKERLEQVEEHFGARRDGLNSKALSTGVPYKPIPAVSLYLLGNEFGASIADRASAQMSPFAQPPGTGKTCLDLGGRQGRNFAAERAAGDVNIFDALSKHVGEMAKDGKRVVLSCWSEGSRERLTQVLADHGLDRTGYAGNESELSKVPAGLTTLILLGLEHGFEIDNLAFIGEQDILGDRLIRQRRRKSKGANILTEASALSPGDLVVHVEHGIGRFIGLKTIEAVGSPHDCLELRYTGSDKLYLPVENIELLTRYGSEDQEVQLDKLGGGAWQARKAKMKKQILEIADGLIKIAAERALRTAPTITAPEGAYDEFSALFVYDETDDQMSAIEAVFDDMASGRPMDRLICGDVGFGKTEVALRAAFLAAMSGRQVALVVPTTLLARQHYRTFADRFNGLPIEVRQASRLVPSKQLSETKKGIKEGTVDIVIGTHALLGKAIGFRDLGLLIIDEEQHFGVKHKERLKELKSDIHVLTLSATPIPRTLQLALTGVRELSLIATPPVDRLAIRSFISPFDPMVIRESLLREHYRGGQSFYVCPRVSDLAEVRAFLEDNVPEVKVVSAHGQMPAGELDDIMNAFYEGKFDVLLATTIVESGLDIPNANTLIVHRSDMFGLAQLYQIRGRVGRSKTRAYALFTVPANKTLTVTAERRLKVLQSLEKLGAGFQLASHDLDIRGAGNILGEEQSGHIKEVGFELYQQMLEEAVAQLKSGGEDFAEEQWSPQISVGTPVLIPESYVPDLLLRLELYRRLADLTDIEDIDGFGAELIDRFGALPEEVQHLLKIVFIKGLCRKANVEKIDAGPKGIVITFRNGEFSNPAGLVSYIAEQSFLAKIRPDQKVVLTRDWPTPDARLKGAAAVLIKLSRLVISE